MVMDISDSQITWRFRPLQPADAPLVTAIENKVFDNAFGVAQVQAEIEAGKSGSVWIDQRLAGYFIAREDGSVFDIIRLAVDPTLQRRGVGRMLVSLAIRECKTAALILTVRMSNKTAIGLYHSFGFTIIGEVESSWVMKLEKQKKD